MVDDLLTIRIGGDRVEAQLVAEERRATGIGVELPTDDASEVRPHLGIAQAHRLLVSASDADRERAIMAACSLVDRVERDAVGGQHLIG